MSYTRGLGALSKAQLQSAQSILPSCYDAELDYCWDDANEHAPGCEKYASLYALYHQDGDAVEELVEALPYCVPYCRPSAMPNIVAPGAPGSTKTYAGLSAGQIAIGAGSFAAGVLVAFLLR